MHRVSFLFAFLLFGGCADLGVHGLLDVDLSACGPSGDSVVDEATYMRLSEGTWYDDSGSRSALASFRADGTFRMLEASDVLEVSQDGTWSFRATNAEEGVICTRSTRGDVEVLTRNYRLLPNGDLLFAGLTMDHVEVRVGP